MDYRGDCCRNRANGSSVGSDFVAILTYFKDNNLEIIPRQLYVAQNQQLRWFRDLTGFLVPGFGPAAGFVQRAVRPGYFCRNLRPRGFGGVGLMAWLKPCPSERTPT
ncbi:hypothetical protein Terro_0070 [Terriglobus roseus DSM 18391]|uniref:Uncharacterized protein n=1 Tax=Terriglobus roseus (strain DSM 18391 / NRRL B-41598 / KBS 63) TaxID=926566 RepID=I3ZB03_TERRK|nr:hypothetical protein Terro_0070 [Terriglobus roseus DSM 18391]